MEAGWSDLPTELIELLVSYCHDQPTLHSLAQVSRHLNTVTTPFLYRHIDVRVNPRRIPRIDVLYQHVRDKPEVANIIQSLRIGFTAEFDENASPGMMGPFDLPKWNWDDQLEAHRNQMILSKPRLHPFLLDAFENQSYGSFAVLLVLELPNLRTLDIATCDQFDHFHSGLSLRPLICEVFSLKGASNDSLYHHAPPVTDVCHNFDKRTGFRYNRPAPHENIEAFFKVPSISKLEFVVPDGGIFTSRRFWMHSVQLQPGQGQCVTTLVLRQSSRAFKDLQTILSNTPQLQSLTCELWYDENGCSLSSQEFTDSLRDVAQLQISLDAVRDTLKTLVISVEYCDTSKTYFEQPNIVKALEAQWQILDLSQFRKLETVELPLPFVTGDLRFSIMWNFEPRLPPQLRHLCLRLDMSQAQFLYPLEISKRLDATFSDMSKREDFKNFARIDLTYLFQTTLFLLDKLSSLESMSVWQPAEPSLGWFDSSIRDFATTCGNKGVLGKVIYPLILRRKSFEHWNLVKEVVAFDPQHPGHSLYEQLVRGEGQHGIPLGLGCQYHIAKVQVFDVPL